jgi:protein-disulfide isomerase
MRIACSTGFGSVWVMSDLSSAPVPELWEGDHVRGGVGEPLVLFYGDFTCPRCVVGYDRLRRAPVRVVFRHMALRAKHPRALALAHAAEAAGLQDAFWPFHDSLYDDAGRTDDPHLWARCELLGLDVARFDLDRRSDEVAARVASDVRAALRAGATATPTVWIGGVRYDGPPPVEALAIS